LANIEQVLQTPSFKKAVKKPHQNQNLVLDKAIKEVIKDPKIGEQKKGGVSFMRVYKFKMVKQLTLLGCSYKDGAIILELIALGTHENFYHDVKKVF
jgi:hypothetical protein